MIVICLYHRPLEIKDVSEPSKAGILQESIPGQRVSETFFKKKIIAVSGFPGHDKENPPPLPEKNTQ
jgi:hypothetical protein